MRRQSFACLSVTSFGGAIFAAASATAPNVTVRPLGAWVMTLFAARHSDAATPHCAAAAAISISRAVAPALRSGSWELRMLRLPPVEKSPQMRLRRRFSSGRGNSVRTLLQSHSSSSATSIGSAVSVPCPISERATRMITVSSPWITIQAVISGAPPAACAPSGTSNPSASPPAAAATLTRNSRRSMPPAAVIAGSVMHSPPRGSPRARADRCRNGKYW